MMDGHKAPFVKSAWICIALLVLGMGYLQTISQEVGEEGQVDEMGLVMTQLQAEYLLGMSSMLEMTEEIIASAEVMNTGTVEQRQRYMAFMIALDELDAAKRSASTVRSVLAEQGREITEEQLQTQLMLETLARGEALQAGHPLFEAQLGWFGALLDADEAERALLVDAAGTKVFVVGSVVIAILVAGFCGLIALVYFIIRACAGSMRSGMIPWASHHGVYAEVFAIWLLLFPLLALVGAAVSNLIDPKNMLLDMIFTLVAFFLSLCSLCWAAIRGISWKQVREDIGWHTGEGLFKEIRCGLAGYAMTVPILGIGILGTLFFMVLQTIFTSSSDADPFGGTGGGAHPIIVEIAQGDAALRVLLLVLAAVAAPLVEETLFRGVLYRHLRSSSSKFGGAISILVSIFIVSFVFAAIHPQGWIAIPALMSIAIGMNLTREWRGSLIAPMIVHGTSNALVIGMMVFFLS